MKKNFTLLPLLMLAIIINVQPVSAYDFWTKYGTIDEEIIDVAGLANGHPVYVSKSNKLYYMENSILMPSDANSVTVVPDLSYYDKILVGTNSSGLFLYDYKTNEWAEFNTNLTDTNVTVLYHGFYINVPNGISVFAKTSDNRLWFTPSDSCNWQLFNGGLEEINIGSVFGRDHYRIVKREYELVVTTNGHGVYGWSEDSLRWMPFNVGIEKDTVVGVYSALDHRNKYFSDFGALYAATKRGIFKLEEDDSTGYRWNPYNHGLNDLRINSITGMDIGGSIINVVGDEFPTINWCTMFISTESGLFYYEEYDEEHGIRWVEDTSGLNGSKINFLCPMNMDFYHCLYAATNQGLYKNNSARIYTYVEENVISDVKIVPNPASNTLQLQTSEKGGTIEIYSSIGRKMMSIEFSNQVDISTLPNGVYFLRINNEFNKFNVYR